MRACAIICEYNPFHTGHAYQIAETKKLIDADIYIGIMCNHFVQRGDIACANALERAKEALSNGLDAVVELPYPYSVQAADKYAEGTIKIAKLLNVDYLSFGSECGDIERLVKASKRKTSKATSKSLASQNISTNSNDILAISYLKQLAGSSITPITIKRTSGYHDTNLNEFASASALRQAQHNKIDISSYTNLSEYMNNPCLEDYYPYLRILLLTLPLSYLKSILLVDEGIENLLYKAASTYDNYEDFLNHVVTKKYTKSRIMRTLTHILLQTTKEDAVALENESFIRILATNKKGLAYLKQIPQEIRISKFNKLPLNYRNYLMKAEALIHNRNEQDLNIELQFPYIKK